MSSSGLQEQQQQQHSLYVLQPVCTACLYVNQPANILRMYISLLRLPWCAVESAWHGWCDLKIVMSAWRHATPK
jgi:hypothetical protein